MDNSTKKDIHLKDIQKMFLLLQNSDIQDLFKEESSMKLIFNINEQNQNNQTNEDQTNEEYKNLLNNSQLQNIFKNKQLMNDISTLQTKMTHQLHNISSSETTNSEEQKYQENFTQIKEILIEFGFEEQNILNEFKLHKNSLECTANVLIDLYTKKKQQNK